MMAKAIARTFTLAALIALAGWAGQIPPARAQSGAVGLWSTKDDASHVKIEPCGDKAEKLCGRIVWLKVPLDETGKPKHDKNNPEASLQARPIIGLKLLSGFVKSAEAKGKWEDGTIYNPEDGETYSCTMTLEDSDHLKVRGYVGLPLFGKSQIWTRVK